jgi:hypothetical protein
MSLANQGKNKEKVIGFDEAGKPQQAKEEQSVTEATPKTIDDIIQESLIPKPIQKEQVSIYLDPEVKKAFDKYGKTHGKGARSMLVNNFIKNAMKANGLLK